jgi:putative DNA primase/helicase
MTQVVIPENDSGWPEPRPIDVNLSPVDPLAPEMLPEAIRAFVTDVAYRMQCPPEYVAVPLIISIASLIGPRAAILPKRKDDWQVSSNLWGGTVGIPGSLKSPALSEVLQFIKQLEREQFQSNTTYDDFFADTATATKTGGSMNIEKKDEVRWRRYYINDASIEKALEIMSVNPNGLLLHQDEIAGWLASIDKPGSEEARAIYLGTWNGDGSYTQDRIGRGTVRVENCILSVVGGIQPSKLQGYLDMCFSTGHNDGLIQRFQLLVYPDAPPEWKYVDEEPDFHARERVREIFQKIDDADFKTLGANVIGKKGVDCFRFDDGGQDVCKNWSINLANQLRQADTHPLLNEHFSKYRKLVPALAMIFHIIAVADGDKPSCVTLKATQMAVLWEEYLQKHAQRIYGLVLGIPIIVTLALLERIADGSLRDGFTVHDVLQKNWSGFKYPSQVQKACKVLEDYGWIRGEKQTPSLAGGRPTTRYRIHPKAIKRP